MEVPRIRGAVVFQSNMNIHEVGNLISKHLLGGLKFQGIEREIYEEVPAIFIDSEIFGFTIILSGYSGFSHDERFILEITPRNFNFRKAFGNNVEFEEYIIDDYLIKIMSYYLDGVDEIKLLY